MKMEVICSFETLVHTGVENGKFLHNFYNHLHDDTENRNPIVTAVRTSNIINEMATEFCMNSSNLKPANG
jgi:hypothetical protein